MTTAENSAYITLDQWRRVYSCTCSYVRKGHAHKPVELNISYTWDGTIVFQIPIRDNESLKDAICKLYYAIDQTKLNAQTHYSKNDRSIYPYSIHFQDFKPTLSCQGSILDTRTQTTRTARITQFSNGHIYVWFSDSFNPSKDKALKFQLLDAFRREAEHYRTAEPEQCPIVTPKPYVSSRSVSSQDSDDELYTPCGRAKNAAAAQLLCYRERQQLQVQSLLDPETPAPKKMATLQSVSPMQMSALTWINNLRYATNNMIIDLVESGWIPKDTQFSFTRSKLNQRLAEMSSYDLIDISKFVTMHEAHPDDSASEALANIYTLGVKGKTLLSELGRDFMYNAFALFQEGNVIKAILAANQWLVYWLSCYPQEFRSSQYYEFSRVIYLRDVDRSGARLHATVSFGDVVLIGEPVRREKNEDELASWITNKMSRLIMLFSAEPDKLYSRTFKTSTICFSSRPIICLICEDEDHARAVHKYLCPLLDSNPEQEVWYTTDLKMFNYNQEGQRFFVFSPDGTQEYIDLAKRLNLGPERSWLTPQEKE